MRGLNPYSPAKPTSLVAPDKAVIQMYTDIGKLIKGNKQLSDVKKRKKLEKLRA